MKRIILDIDDTLNNLSLDLLRFDGLNFASYDDIPDWPWGYDIISAIAELKGEEPMGLVEYWQRLPRSLWATTTLAPDFDAILSFCDDKVGLGNVLIASSPTKCPECLAGKYEWMMSEMPRELHRQWSITPRKWEYGRDKHAVLIDDVWGNCQKFHTGDPEDNYAARGRSLLVPRPWNHLRGTNIMEALNTQWDYHGQYPV